MARPFGATSRPKKNTADDASGRGGAAGTKVCLFRFLRMRIREENCNMVLLAVVALFTVAIASGANLLGPSERKQADLAERITAARAEQTRPADKQVVYVADQPPVRVVGAPFVPNTNPRER